MDKLIGTLAHIVPNAPTNLKHYPVIVLGSNIGGIFTNIFTHYDHGHTPLFATYGKEEHCLH